VDLLTSEQLPEQHLPDAIMANDRLLKALISLLVVEQPDRLHQLRTIFELASQMRSPIADMPDWTWNRIKQELDVIGASFGPDLH
jgi:hypothetical protein